MSLIIELLPRRVRAYYCVISSCHTGCVRVGPKRRQKLSDALTSEKEFIGVMMKINSKIAVQRGGIMVYSRINWLTRSVKGRAVKALMYISTRRRDKIGKPAIENRKGKRTGKNFLCCLQSIYAVST